MQASWRTRGGHLAEQGCKLSSRHPPISTIATSIGIAATGADGSEHSRQVPWGARSVDCPASPPVTHSKGLVCCSVSDVEPAGQAGPVTCPRL